MSAHKNRHVLAWNEIILISTLNYLSTLQKYLFKKYTWPMPASVGASKIKISNKNIYLYFLNNNDFRH